MARNPRSLLFGRRRPKRERVPTTYYTDDNPSTFTVKKTKAERLAEAEELERQKEEERLTEEEEEPPVRQKRKYTRRKDVAGNSTTTDSNRRPASPVVSSPAIETTAAVEQPVKRKRGRPPKNAPRINHVSKPVAATTTAAAKPKPSTPSSVAPLQTRSSSITTTANTPPSSTHAQPGRKRRRPGRPPSNKKTPPKPSPKSTPSERKISTRNAAAPPPSSPPPPPVVDQMGTLLPQSVTVAPILPPTAETDFRTINDKHRLSEQYPALFSKGLGIPPPLKKREWSLLYNPDIYFDRDYIDDDVNDDGDDDENQVGDDPTSGRRARSCRRLDPDLMPVTRSVTCVTTRRPDHQFMAVGDTSGFCVIYNLGPHLRPVARLESQACKQRAYEQQQSVREQQKKIITKKLRSLVVDTSQTAIQALALVGSRVVLATSCELECMDVPSGASLWVCPLSSTDRMVTSLDMHVSTYDVLVSCRLPAHAKAFGGATASTTGSDNNDNNASERAPAPGAAPPTSPLMLLKHSQNNIEICDANSPILVKSPCCSAIWDSSPSNEDRLLFVAPDQESQELELVLVEGGSIDNWKVACKTRIPVKSSIFQTKLSQSPQGAFTMVASSRGIRLYQTETLQLLHIYGDQLALHGRSIVWQDCLLLGHHRHQTYYRASRLDDGGVHGNEDDGDKLRIPPPPPRGPDLIEYEDALSPNATGVPTSGNDPQSSAPASDEDFADLGQYIVGVPDPSKGPKELCETLHVWKVAQPTTVPAHTIALPPKSDGVQSLVLSSQTPARSRSSATSNALNTHDRLVLATRSGECHELLPEVESDFAGIMYPAGYYVLDDNLEYIEDEDETDIVIPNEEDHDLTHVRSEEEEEPTSRRRRKFFVPDSEDEEDGGDMDDASDQDLKEAMRRSMLELRHTPGGIESKDDDNVSVVVDVVDDTNLIDQVPPTRVPILLPCRPEAYLQETVIPDGRRKRAGDKSPARDQGEDSGFIHQVLGIMPHFSVVEKSRQELEKRLAKNSKGQAQQATQQQQESQESETVFSAGNANATTAANGNSKQDSNSLAALRTGRSKRSRAGNLEAMLKSSIDPYLQNLMASRELRWAAGTGSFLVESDETTKEPNPASEVASAGAENGSNILENGDSSNADAARKSSADVEIPKEQAEDVLAAKLTQPAVSSLNADNGKDSTGLARSSNVDATPTGGRQGGVESSALLANMRADEAAVAFGLLGLSPCLTNTNSDRGSIIDESGSDFSRGEKQSPVPSSKKRVVAAGTPNVKCLACRGRMVIHICGKRSLPIDFDEVVRAERDRKEKEEEEKRKQRAEKRRLADARRREARKQKQRELEELKKREEEEQRRRENARLAYDQVAVVARQSFAHEVHQNQTYEQAQDQIPQPAYAAPVERSALTKPPDLASSTPWAATSDRIDTHNYSAQPRVQEPVARTTAAYSYTEPTSNGAPRQTETWSDNNSKVVSLNSYDSSVATGDSGGDAARTPVSKMIREASGATLSSAEALAALASIAGSQSAVEIEKPPGLDRPQPRQQYPYDESSTPYSDTAAAAATYTNSSHGFNEGVPSLNDYSSSVSALRGVIPSYATIRAQETENDVGFEAASNGIANHKTEQQWPMQNGYSAQPSNAEKSRWQY